MAAFIFAFAILYIVFGVLISTGCQRANKRRGEPYSSGAFHMMVALWPLLMLMVLCEKDTSTK